MGNRARYPATSGGSIARDYVELKIQGNGAGAPTVLAGKSWLAVATPVTHTGGTNVLGVTLRDPWPEVVLHSCDVRDDAGNGAYCTVGNFANEAAAVPNTPITFNLRSFNAGGTALNDASLVFVVGLAIRTSSVTYGNQ